MTESIKGAVKETERRRKIQIDYNMQNNIIPKTIIKPIREKKLMRLKTSCTYKTRNTNLIIELEKQMSEASEKLDFETAIRLEIR